VNDNGFHSIDLEPTINSELGVSMVRSACVLNKQGAESHLVSAA
jgi:hypothetical protein